MFNQSGREDSYPAMRNLSLRGEQSKYPGCIRFRGNRTDYIFPSLLTSTSVLTVAR
jgi:hypothetical protein